MNKMVDLQVPLNGGVGVSPAVPPWSNHILEHQLTELDQFTPKTINKLSIRSLTDDVRPPDRVHHASFAEEIAVVEEYGSSIGSQSDKFGKNKKHYLTVHNSENEIPLRRQRSRERAQSVSAVLRASGIDVAGLRNAFSALDVQGDGGLERFEFRRMWKEIFPQRPLDQESWKTTERMFSEIDFDGSGVITFEEIIAYLEQNRQTELRQGNGPTTMRQWIWAFAGTESGPPSTSGSIRILIYIWKLLGQVLMIVNVTCLMVESMPASQPNAERFYHSDAETDITRTLQIICNMFFSVELIGYCIGYPDKIVYSNESQTDHHDSDSEDLGGTMKTIQIATALNDEGNVKVMKFAFLLRWEFWIELAALVGFYIDFISSSDVIELRGLAIFRIFRITTAIRALRYTGLFKTRNIPELGAALRKSFISLLFLFILLATCIFISATLIFYAETRDAKFMNGSWYRLNDTKYGSAAGARIQFQSIPESLWWGIVTITTVGYGDMYPDTFWGRAVAACTMFAGVVVVSFPITILQSTFQQMEEGRLERELKLENCKEFYDAIKQWLETGARVTKDPKLLSSAPSSRRPTAMGPIDGMHNLSNGSSEHMTTLCTNIESLFKKTINQLEAGMSARFDRLESRISRLEDVIVRQQVSSNNSVSSPSGSNQKKFFINLEEPPLI